MTSIKFRALTHNDHKLFFEALGEYGKDFQNIQQYMTQKCGKNSSRAADQNKSADPQEKRDQEKKDEDKKREQIRNFYNKLYGKLSQLVGKLDDRIEKVNQELYLLINYGEIWKKHGFKFNNKTKKLLEELVHHGYTTLRFKNKNVRLRTPPCKALKKINEIGVDEKVKVVTTRELPKDVAVEFHPSTNRDWLKVQSISQNPRVRARLSIQKRVSYILEFLENKWNISPDKLNRTVDAWLKVPPSNQILEDIQQVPSNVTTASQNGTQTNRIENNNVSGCNANLPDQTLTNSEIRHRIRLKPSPQHELKEVNITRVVPDNHLDLSLNSYISRLTENPSKKTETSSKSYFREASSNHNSSQNNASATGLTMPTQNQELSQGAISSRLPVFLTTPDSSILLERSITSDQPSIAQTRKHLNILQSIAGSFEGCENSRTACEDTQDRSIHPPLTVNGDSNRFACFGDQPLSSEVVAASSSGEVQANYHSIPALFDEDAAIDTALPLPSSQDKSRSSPVEHQMLSNNHCSDSQNSKSVDFHIPKNLTLGDWFKMADHTGGDEANDAFPLNQTTELREDLENFSEKPIEEKDTSCKVSKNENTINNPLKSTNHMIEMKKLAEGWTRGEDSSITIGELYLAFKCPDKIVLEYEFEQFSLNHYQAFDIDAQQQNSHDQKSLITDQTTVVAENLSNDTLVFKLLTAASLSLAHIERQKHEQQLKLSEQQQPSAKLKRRKGPTNPNTIKYLKRDDTMASNKSLRASVSGQPQESDRFSSIHGQHTDNNNYMMSGNEKSQGQGQVMTLHDIEATNQRVEEALKQLQPTRLSVFRRAR